MNMEKLGLNFSDEVYFALKIKINKLIKIMYQHYLEGL